MKYYSIFLLFFMFLGFHLIAQDEISIIQIPSIPENSSIRDLFISGDEVYIAASTGFYKINSKSMATIQLSETPADAICMTSKKELWVSFEQRYLENINTGMKTNYNIPGIEINDLESYKGKIWIASNQGILSVNTRTNEMGSTQSERNSELETNDIVFLHLDDQDQMWVGTNEGIVLINKKEKWKTYEKKLKMEAMHYNHEGLWLVSNKEMWLVDPYNRWYPTAVEKGLKEGKIRDITADSTGRLYMASDILVRYDPYTELIESYKDEPGLVSKQCTSVESDKDNRIWIGTANSGLFLLGFKKEAIQTSLSALMIIEDNIKCLGGEATVNVNVFGGTKPYSIQWQDNNSNSRKRNLGAGSYEVLIGDAAGETVTKQVNIEDISGITISVLETEQESSVGKKDAKAKILISGGEPPYNVQWPNGESGTKALQLTNGIHQIKVTDANKCNLVSTIEIKALKLIPELQISKIKVGQTLQINNLFFQADSTDLLNESYAVLDEIYDFMQGNQTVVIEIGGHTNDIPTHEYCDKLSMERARSVANYLYLKGIPETKISFKGYGKRNPIASNRTVEGRKKNQRVEIKILSITK